MKTLITTLAIAGLAATMSTGLFAGEVKGKVNTTATLGDVTQSSAGGGARNPGINEVNISNVTEEGKVGRGGEMNTTVTTDSITQTARPGGVNKINVGNVSGSSSSSSGDGAHEHD